MSVFERNLFDCEINVNMFDKTDKNINMNNINMNTLKEIADRFGRDAIINYILSQAEKSKDFQNPLNMLVLKSVVENIFNNVNLDSFDSFNKDFEKGLKILGKLSLYQKKEIPETLTNDELKNYGILRTPVARCSGLPLLTKQWIKMLADYIGRGRCLEVCSGLGALSKSLQDCGIDIICTNLLHNDVYAFDYKKPENRWTHVEKMDCFDAVKLYGSNVDFMIGSWIEVNKSDRDFDLYKCFKEQNPNGKFIMIGLINGGFSTNFMSASKLTDTHIWSNINKHFPSWSREYDDYLIIVE